MAQEEQSTSSSTSNTDAAVASARDAVADLGSSATGTDPGLFNFEEVMEQFYGWNPTDEAGIAIKQAFAANMVQTGFDAQVAMQQAYVNAGIGTEQMSHAAELDLANTLDIMNQQFDEDTAKMQAEYEYQEQFAKDESDRAKDEATHQAEIDSDQSAQEHEQDLALTEKEAAELRRLERVKQDGEQTLSAQEAKQLEDLQQKQQEHESALSKQEHKQEGALSKQEAKQLEELTKLQQSGERDLSKQEQNS